MFSLSPAFAIPTSLTLTPRRTTLLNTQCRRLTVTTSRRRPHIRMADETEQEEVTVSAAEILKTMREESSSETVRRDDGTRSSRNMLGVYRDVDGKSNIWAVEPVEQTDTSPQISKATIIAVAAAFIAAALLVLPLLPFTNPDQL